MTEEFNKLKAFFSAHALDTYIDGVNKGYLDGLREQHVVHQTAPLIDDRQRQEIKQRFADQTKPSIPASPGGNAMNPILENQLDTLRNVKAFLQQFNDNLQTSSERYQRFIDDLAEQQLDAQIYERYQAEFLDETKSRIQQIIENIESGDIPYIERLIRHLEETQAAAMG
jgi:hypothetical protein